MICSICKTELWNYGQLHRIALLLNQVNLLASFAKENMLEKLISLNQGWDTFFY